MKFVPQAARLALCAALASSVVLGTAGASHAKKDSGWSPSSISAKKDSGWSIQAISAKKDSGW
ncbi:hypothetical protein GCM10011519_23160 [Marmoricola endophyticus]|uniref:Uncharacterized protein n=1 Tax=Marmoricola endophyticus TaxID=2040280 RepID=A0A917F384_9ACTN|nr:hypothetical protein [Marmoricola endophyticus]GGF48501.1 hypothetical protein GCM10011519_23160 [Marmoricola endophyticus]